MVNIVTIVGAPHTCKVSALLPGNLFRLPGNPSVYIKIGGGFQDAIDLASGVKFAFSPEASVMPLGIFDRVELKPAP